MLRIIASRQLLRRSYSTNPSSFPANGKKSKYIILGAKSSNLYPKKKRPNVEINKVQPLSLEQQQKQLMEFKSHTPEQVVAESINIMKPISNIVSEKRWNQLANDLIKSFSVDQLRNFVHQHGIQIPKKIVKRRCVDIIKKSIWNLAISKDINENSDVIVENTLNLPKRDLVLLLSRNGEIPRSWTKSGARIIVLSEKATIVIRSTQETYEWILASLHRKLSDIEKSTFDLSGLKQLRSSSSGTSSSPPPKINIPLKQIQNLSNTYMEYNSSSGDQIDIYGFKSADIDLARRLIVYSSGYHPGMETDYVQHIGNESESSTGFTRFIDDDAQDWTERSKTWYRQQLPKKKTTPESFIVKGLPKQRLDVRTLRFNAAGQKPINDKHDINKSESGYEMTLDNDQLVPELANRLHNKIKTPNSNDPLTITATFGYLLTDPNNSYDRTFASNIPGVLEQSRGLPYYDMDVEFDESELRFEKGNVIEADEKGAQLSGDDAWEQVLNAHNQQQSGKKKAYRSKQLEDVSSYMVQLRFVPSPSVSSVQNLDNLPAVEVWMELDHRDIADPRTCRVMAVKQDYNMVLPLPDQPSDIKFNISQAKALPHLEEEDPIQASYISEYLSSCVLDFSGNVPVSVPETLKLRIDNQAVTYAYQGLYHRQQIEHKFQNHILLLSTVEGGGIGGRRVEVQLVKDYESALEDGYSENDMIQLVQTALNFNKLLLH